MLKREFHGADFSFDYIGLVTSVCRHQHIVQGLLAFLQPFNVLSYGAIHKVASVRKRTERLRHNPLEIVRRLLSVFPTNPESGSVLIWALAILFCYLGVFSLIGTLTRWCPTAIAKWPSG